jgi:acetyl-CoA carboxylase biotin carboxyl carrier protein
MLKKDRQEKVMSHFELDTEAVRKLALLLKETGLSEIEYVVGDKKIRCATASFAMPQFAAPLPAAASALPAPAAVAAQPEAPKAPAGTPVPSPMVGTAYLAPEPGAAPFVKAGDKVKEGDTLLIIEAMKVMNPIKAPKAGTIAEILITDAKPVEFGEPLMLIA